MTLALGLIILAVGAFTAGTRIIPLFLNRHNDKHRRKRPEWLDHLGPVLLAAMATVVILPQLNLASENHTLMAAALSLGSVAAAMMIRPDPGLATITGMIFYYLLS